MSERRTIGPYTTGERPEPITVAFTEDDGAVLDLTGFTTATWSFRARGGDTVTAAAAITDAEAGEVTYTWAAGDLDAAGVYYAEMTVTSLDNKLVSRRFVFRVRQALAAA